MRSTHCVGRVFSSGPTNISSVFLVGVLLVRQGASDVPFFFLLSTTHVHFSLRIPQLSVVCNNVFQFTKELHQKGNFCLLLNGQLQTINNGILITSNNSTLLSNSVKIVCCINCWTVYWYIKGGPKLNFIPFYSECLRLKISNWKLWVSLCSVGQFWLNGKCRFYSSRTVAYATHHLDGFHRINLRPFNWTNCAALRIFFRDSFCWISTFGKQPKQGPTVYWWEQSVPHCWPWSAFAK